MEQKINPITNRLGYIHGWDSNWSGGRNYDDTLVKDDRIRKYLHARLSGVLVDRIIIECALGVAIIAICTARPSMIVEKSGQNVENLKAELKKITKTDNIQINICEACKPEVGTVIVASDIARRLEGHMSHRRTTKMVIVNAMHADTEDIKIQFSGRLNNAEMARAELYKKGRTPLHALRVDIDYAQTGALTKVGMIGVKVWVMNGEMYERRDLAPDLSRLCRQAGRRSGDSRGDRRGDFRRGGCNRSNC